MEKETCPEDGKSHDAINLIKFPGLFVLSNKEVWPMLDI